MSALARLEAATRDMAPVELEDRVNVALVRAYEERMAAVTALLVAAGCKVEAANDPDADLIVTLDIGGGETGRWALRLDVAAGYAAEIQAGADAFEVLGDSVYDVEGVE